MLAIIHCSIGNISSVANAFRKLGEEVIISNEMKTLKKADYVVFPGVGSFQCMDEIRKTGLAENIYEIIKSGKPFLGICIGFQVLFEKSFEHNETEGLGIMKGNVLPFSKAFKDKNKNLKIPQIGWNQVMVQKKSQLFKNIPDGSYFYFVHSYYAQPENKDCILAKTDYGISYCSAIEIDNVVGVQFHPEKSQKIGLQFLKNFLEKK